MNKRTESGVGGICRAYCPRSPRVEHTRVLRWDAMRITLNGDPHDLPGPMSVTALLAHLKIDGRRVAVEHNLTVLKRATFDSVTIQEGDQVEIVNFVGGG